MQRRVVSVWLPRFRTEVLTQEHAVATGRAVGGLGLAAIVEDQAGLLVAAVDPIADSAGVRPGMTLADARAVLPSLTVLPAVPGAEHRRLNRLAAGCLRYTPWQSTDPPDAIVLDITGCAHLFGGESALCTDLERRFSWAGWEARTAAAPNASAAWGLARFGGRPGGMAPVVAAQDLVAVLSAMPIAALRVPSDSVAALARVGCRRIGDLTPIDRAALGRRFGVAVIDRLDRALGRRDDPISPQQPVPLHTERLRFADPVSIRGQIDRALARLLARLCRGLEAAGMGARRLVLYAHGIDARCDEPPQEIAIGTGRPVRDAMALQRLFAQKLEQLRPGDGFEVLVLVAVAVEPFTPEQATLEGFAEAPVRADVGDLIDRLANRLGEGRVTQAKLRESWQPERAVERVSAGQESVPPWPPIGALETWPDGRERPVRLFIRPEPIDVVAPVPDDPPILFRWRSRVHRINKAEGPERLAPEWWRADAGRTRDYYRVEDRDGGRFWLYRDTSIDPGKQSPWFLHGVFA